MIKNFNCEIFSSSRQAIFSLNLALLCHSIWPDNDVKDYTELELEFEYNRIKQKKSVLSANQRKLVIELYENKK